MVELGISGPMQLIV